MIERRTADILVNLKS